MKQPPKKSKPRSAAPEAKPLSAGQKWLFRLVALVVIPLCLLAGMEVVLRLAGYGYDTSLFKEIQIGSGRFLVNNDNFGLRFFPPQLERFTGPIRMPAIKPADTCRIFILGESAAMGDPEPAYGASRYLEALLSLRYPQTHFEIVNVGITAINSHVILPIARDCAKQAGDIWIIYMGNNEMVGPFGAATVFGAKAPPLAVIRLNLAIQKSRLGQLLINVGRKLKRGKEGAPSWGGMEMFVGNNLAMNDPRREVVYENFSRNLDDIVKAGLRSGAKVLLNTVAVNLKDCAPFASLADTNLPPATQSQFEQLLKTGAEAEEQGDLNAAAQNFEAAAKLDPEFAELQYRWGKSLFGLNNFPAASNHLQLACDYDALPFRTDSRINAIIRDEPKKNGGNDLILLDAANALAAENQGNICGAETFYEHVHFDFDGSYRLGLAWAEQVSRLLPPKLETTPAGGWAGQETCERRLGLSDWNRKLVLQHMIGRMEQPPLSAQLGNAERLKKLEDRVAALRPLTTADRAPAARKEFEETLRREPEDYLLRENFALFLQLNGDLPQAIAEWRKIQALLPQDYLTYFQIGKLLEKQQAWAEAETSLKQTVAIHPSFTEGWQELANTLFAENKLEPALADYQRAGQLRPQDPQNYFQSAQILAKLNRHEEARADYRAAIKLDPSNWEPHFELGGELDAAGQLEPARLEFAEAARLNPDFSRAHFNYGVLLAKQGKLAEARREFETTLRLEPGYEKAQVYLRQIKILEKRAP